MRYVSCPTAVISAPVDVVWALFMDPAGWERVFDMRVAGIDPPGPAVVGQKVCGETGPRIFHLKLTLRIMEIDPDYRWASLLKRIFAAHLSTTSTAG